MSVIHGYTRESGVRSLERCIEKILRKAATMIMIDGKKSVTVSVKNLEKFLGKRIKCTHIHNNFKRQDLHLPPDCGDINWENVMHAFYEIGYDGPLTLETHCLYPDDDMLRAFAKFNLAGLDMIEKHYK